MKLLSRNPDKPKKQLETTIGKIIYGFLLFMPLLAVAVACGYVVFNKNAYQSYSDKYVTDIVQVTNTNMFIVDETYEAINHFEQTGDSPIIYYNSVDKDFNELLNTGTDIDYKGFNFRSGGGSYINMFLYDENNTRHGYVVYDVNPVYETLKHITFTYNSGGGISNLATFYRYVQVQSSLDNVFYYQLEHLEDSTLFNWTKQTGTYDVVHNTTTLLGITNTYIPMLLTYWLMISVMYFVYDIALMLIMVVHRKIHELQESI